MTCTIYILTPRTVIWRRQGLMAISIHALQTECDAIIDTKRLEAREFLSTHSKRSATRYTSKHRIKTYNFYPRTPNGVRLSLSKASPRCRKFLSTHSKRSATDGTDYCYTVYTISIHALQTECDMATYFRAANYFISIHALQTECDVVIQFVVEYEVVFLSTHSKRSATLRGCRDLTSRVYFYPRTPNGVRQRAANKLRANAYFYPRTPNGVRQFQIMVNQPSTPISIHALQTECDCISSCSSLCCTISIHALQTECDHRPNESFILLFEFLSTHSKRSATTSRV